jgi:hypothetical protein
MSKTFTNIPRPRAATSVATRIGDLPFRNSAKKKNANLCKIHEVQTKRYHVLK